MTTRRPLTLTLALLLLTLTLALALAIVTPAAARPSYRISPRTQAKIALPTLSQLAWMDDEVSMLIHYNIATYLTDPSLDGCNNEPHLVPDISTFQPTQINTSQWVDVMQSFGARSAVLVVKHNCGLTTWPFNTTFTLATGEQVWYNYTISNSDYPSLDLAASLAASLAQRNLTLGFYASTQWNDYLNVYAGALNSGALQPGQVNVTLQTYDTIVQSMLADLWARYGALREVWFDGGYTQAQRDALSTLIAKYQPNAVAFNAFVADNYTNPLTFNAAKWIGTELGNAPYPTWSAGTCAQGSGDPSEPYFCPANCDTTLQADDTWFWRPNKDLRSLTELIGVYHTTVGRNCKLQMDLTPDTTGLIPKAYAERYAQVGSFVAQCYGKPVQAQSTKSVYGERAVLTGNSDWNAFSARSPLEAVLADDADVALRITLTFASAVEVDRVMIVEDQTNGQVVMQYTVEVQMASEGAAVAVAAAAPAWTLVSNGTSVGFKRIDLWPARVSITAVRFTVVDALDTPVIRSFTAHNCADLERQAAEMDAAAERAVARAAADADAVRVAVPVHYVHAVVAA